MRLPHLIKQQAYETTAWTWCRLQKDFLAVFNWHQVTPVFDPLLHHTHIWTRLDHFRNEISCLAAHYHILPLHEAIDRLKKGRLTGPCAALSFDDGDASAATHVVPFLKELNLPATFFINTAYLNEHASYWFPISYYLASTRSAGSAAVFPKELEDKAKELRQTRDAEFYQKTRLEIEALGYLVPNLKTRLVSPEWLATLDGEQFTIGAHGHEHERRAMMPLDWQRNDLRQNIAILSQFKAFRPLFAAPFGRDGDWTGETFQIARDLRVEFLEAEGGIHLANDPPYRRIAGDGGRNLQSEIGLAIINQSLRRWKPSGSPAKRLYVCTVRHLLTGSPCQLGGVASVVGELLKLEEIRSDFNVSAVWTNNNELKRRALAGFKARVLSKINRTLSRDPHSHPYRYPQINHLRSSRLEYNGNTVLHVHKANLWRQAARWKIENPDVALVFHAHSVEGFTGGCVLEGECQALAKQCQDCPIIQPYAKALPRLGFKNRARLLQSVHPVIIANSEATYRAITSSGLIPNTCRVETVPPGTDPRLFFTPTDIDRTRRIQQQGLRIGFVSYSIENPNKGFEDFVQTVRFLKEDLNACGDAAGEVNLETVERFPEIQFNGPIHDDNQLRKFYQSVDYLVVPSRSESFGLVSIEAQFCGTPVVCYNVGGLPETVKDMVTGLVVRPRTPEALADGIKRLHRQGLPLVLDPACNQVRAYLEKFQTDRINAKYADIYESLFPEA